jgi:hypothetical protein
MKYSNYIGIIACLLLMYACTLHWIYIGTPEHFLTGFTNNVDNNPFGKPGKLHVFFSGIALLFFAIPKVWAKRTAPIITALNLAFGIRNFFAIGMTCRAGVCPHKELGIYLIFICSIIIFLMSLLPKMQVQSNEE